MKKTIIAFLFFFCILNAFSQNKHFNYYYQRTTLFDVFPTSKKDIVFLGNSMTNGCEWSELFSNPHIRNRGINGDIAEGVYDRISQIIKGKPKKIFLMIGINDLNRSIPIDTTTFYIYKTIKEIKKNSPKTKIYLQSILPVNGDFSKFSDLIIKENGILIMNDKLKEIASANDIEFINLYPHFTINGENILNPEYTNDGIHLTANGYLLWKKILMPYIK